MEKKPLVEKVEIDYSRIGKNKEFDAQIMQELKGRLEEELLTESDNDIKVALADRINKITILLQNLQENVIKIRQRKENSRKDNYKTNVTEGELKVDKLLGNQLIEMYKREKELWSDNVGVGKIGLHSNEFMYLEKLYQLSIIFENFNQNMDILGKEKIF